ncbi:DUF4959 domain-containing protein [Niabella ginsengisoli]|uniref:DUF4959 domain-containing protein n=1 Tax=Niabella ginsengisoli TaxID=522298 RepID=A0ABS9SHM5_9BACT|nr:DUF4959 domain-containing protein [Niabella ginsengisoli]MCH5597871.1 DUF4959 domain-containing protein [Niabella ginsengisoli]
MKQIIHKKLLMLFGVIMSISLISGCKEDVGITVNRIGQKPPPVTNIRTTSISGGAYIKYDLPLAEDLRYVKATYKLDNGIEREAKSSIYKNELLVDGFGEEGMYDIELTAVAVGEVESEPVTVKVNVLTPPHKVVFEKLKEGDNIQATFGGINLKYVNETNADIVIRVLRKDSLGNWQQASSEYTSLDSGVVRMRGLKAGEAEFGVFVEDRWDHFSDTLKVTLTPLEEVPLLDDGRYAYRLLDLPGDVPVNSASWVDKNGIWDDDYTSGGRFYTQTNEGYELPLSLTIDLNTPALLSRMIYWTWWGSSSGTYGATHMYDFAVYGSNDPNPDGSWDSWTFIDRFLSIRPSGLGFGVSASEEEVENLKENGETYEFSDPLAFPKFRYIRLRIYANWSGRYSGEVGTYISELDLFGQR